MKKYEDRMTHYILDGDVLKPIEPTLQPGEKKTSLCSRTNQHYMQMNSSCQLGVHTLMIQGENEDLILTCAGFKKMRFFSNGNPKVS
jgi:hypothetical protein